ncbi:group 1 truncated hemoglobin [Marinobacter hydrocarbonoclasticus]|nr:group 1 truncated hemoglobin [Marinobacter nauticus]
MTTSLFERLGGEDGIRRIANEVVDLHSQNPLISARFAGSDLPRLKETVAKFFIAGSGGPSIYDGRDMLTTHRHMNISDNEYMAVVDDAMTALTRCGIGDTEKGEVLFIFYSLRPDIVGV